jgi:hypothetical protein
MLLLPVILLIVIFLAAEVTVTNGNNNMWRTSLVNAWNLPRDRTTVYI